MDNPLQARLELVLRNARRDFGSFCLTVNPNYEMAWFHSEICGTLNAMVRGECKRLILTMPPRHGKSELISRKLPAFWFGHFPKTQIISTSYGFELTKTFSRDVRDVMAEPIYRAIFPQTQLSRDVTAMDLWQTQQGGVYLAQGVGGSITGHGADLLICDDLISNREQAESSLQLNKVWDFYTGSLYTRLHPGAAIIIIMTRWSPQDPVGRILTSEDVDEWKVLHYPAINEQGAALWPEKYSRETLEQTRRSIGSYDFTSLYQGEPYARGGQYLKRAWFRVIAEAEVPAELTWVRGLDLAVSTKKSADSSASVKIARHDQDGESMMYIAGGWNQQLEWPHAKRKVVALATQERIQLYVEAVAGFVVAYRELRDSLDGIAFVDKITVSKDKLSRALPWIAMAERGGVCLVRGKGDNEWIEQFLSQCDQFPTGSGHDDLIDAVSIAHEGNARCPSMA
jgi:predicted phage terminase large subunit-like protein